MHKITGERSQCPITQDKGRRVNSGLEVVVVVIYQCLLLLIKSIFTHTTTLIKRSLPSGAYRAGRETHTLIDDTWKCLSL